MQTQELETLISAMQDQVYRQHDPVSFVSKRGDEQGFIASVKGQTAVVVVDDGREYRVPVRLLKLRPGVPPQRVHTRNDAARVDFKEKDLVSFTDKKSVRHTGHIVKLNQKSARVNCDDLTWKVGYVDLVLQRDNDSSTNNRLRLREIEAEAEALLQKHELVNWRFVFDQASKRGGLCGHHRREISLSEQFSLAAPREEVTDTILHEIAHALTGPKHGHDEVWKAMAKRIGCSVRITHDIGFSVPRWVISCPKCGWRIRRHRRRRNLVCATCGEALVCQLNDEISSNSIKARMT